MSQRSRTDLCGGCRATGIPTATLFSRPRTCTTGCYDGVFWLEQVRTAEPVASFERARETDSVEMPLPPDG